MPDRILHICSNQWTNALIVRLINYSSMFITFEILYRAELLFNHLIESINITIHINY